MSEGYCSRFVCVCASVTTLPATDAVSMSQTRCCKVPYRVSIVTYCVDLAGNPPFKSSGVICRSPPPSSLPDERLMNKRDSNGFFSTRRISMAWLEIDSTS
jgi:hypothetical protein